MVDKLSKEKRSWNMSRIRSKDTVPELTVRSMLYRMGYRFRLHRKDLPGTPDIVLPKYKIVIFVHGCYWHRHKGCKLAYVPKSSSDGEEGLQKLLNKFKRNVERHKENRDDLIKLGWRVIVIWECETKNLPVLYKKIEKLFK